MIFSKEVLTKNTKEEKTTKRESKIAYLFCTDILLKL